jgi:hypothetical protein
MVRRKVQNSIVIKNVGSACVCISAQPLRSHETLSKFINLSEAQFPLYDGITLAFTTML